MFDTSKLDKIEKYLKIWKEKNIKPESKTLSNRSGITIDFLYTPNHISENDYLRDLNFPGEYPFTRGVYPTMYRRRLWTMRQYAGFGTAEDTNKRYKYLLQQGQTGLSVAFDLPTQIGYDSDDPMAVAEIGKVGVAIDSLKDMEILFEGIPLGKITTSMTINSTAPQILSMYLAVAMKQNVPLTNVGGTVQNDILKEYVARGTYIYPPEPSMRLVADIIEFGYKNTPKFNTISISGYHIREAGSTAVQEIAFTLANAIAYVKAVIDRGITVDKFAPQLSFFFCCQNDLFEEVAKFRAARRLWAKIMKERFKAKDPRSMFLRFHTQTSGYALTAQQPEVNLIRVAMQTLAAVLGGTQSLHTNSYDEALALPSDNAVTLALRTQQIIAYESKVTSTVDPLGGSYYVEYLTDEIEEKASEYISKIDDMGGATVAIEKGFYQKEIADSAYKYQCDVESKKEIIVGVNEFISEEEPPVKILRVDPKVRDRQINKVKQVRKERDSRKVEEALNKLQKAAEGEENLTNLILEAVKSYATIGETTQVLKNIFGEYKATTVI